MARIQTAPAVRVELTERPQACPCSLCGEIDARSLELRGRRLETFVVETDAFVCGGCALGLWRDEFLRRARAALEASLYESPISDFAMPEMAELFLIEPNPNVPSGIGFVILGQLRVFLNDTTFPMPGHAGSIFIFFTEMERDGERLQLIVSSNAAPSLGECALCGHARNRPRMGVRGRYDEVMLVGGGYLCWPCVDAGLPALVDLYNLLQRGVGAGRLTLGH